MKKRNLFKIAALTAVFALGSMFANAQQTSGNVIKQGNADPGAVNGSVKLIDNKGTVKYLQVQNGLTMITNTTTDVTTTTWQLGGTLTDDTYIDATGKIFGLDGIPVTADAAATTSTVDLDHNDATPGGSGWTLLVRNEATGRIEKMLATNLIQSGHQVFVASANQTVYDLLPASTHFLPLFKNVYVYRNGAKLIAGEDYTITDDDTFTLINTGAATPTFEPYPIYAGDRIEVQFIK